MQNVIPFYPTYALLDSVMSYSKYNTLNIYVDLKSVAYGLYIEHIIINIVELTRMSRQTDSSFFTSLLDFLIFHKLYALKRGIMINFYVFYELGESFYHLHIDKKYKANRKIDNIPGLDEKTKDLYFSIIKKNLILIDKVFNNIPNIKIILIKHLETDFIPYYLIRNNLVSTTKNICHLVYSNDHDLLQNLIFNNVYQFMKTNIKRILKKGDVTSQYLKHKCDIPVEYFPLVMAILGDKNDNILDKVKGIGKKTVPKIINDIVDLVGDMNLLYDNVFNNKPIFKYNVKNKIDNKNIYSVVKAEEKRSTISKNLKLMSFELLSRYLDKSSSVEAIQGRKHIYNVVNNSIVSKSESIYIALNKIGVLTEIENPFDILYSNKNISDYKF